MKGDAKTKQQLLVEMEELRRRLDSAGQRLQEADKVLQAEITERKRVEETFEKAQRYAKNIVETIREPLLVLTADLKVISANQSFYQTFKVTPKETEGRFVYSIGNHQWDIPALRKLLEEIVPQNTHFNDFEVDHTFPAIGRRRMFLNARRIHRQGRGTDMILLAIEDVTERKQMEEALEVSEVRFRRLFETAQDGILILEADTGIISSVNPFLTDMLGYGQDHFWGKKLWEIGAFKDIQASKAAFSELQTKGYVRYENLPLQTRDGRLIAVEFVSNVYFVDHKKVIQCNIRDITERKRAEQALREAHERAVWLARFPEQNPHPILRASADGTVLYCNPASAKLHGWTCEVGQLLQNELLPLVGRAMTEGREVQQDVQLGGKFYFLWVVPFPEERYVNIYGRDITERKKTEEKLRAREERYRSYIEVTGQLAWTTNPDGEVVEDIPEWRKFTGQSEEETRGAGWAKALHPDDVKHTMEAWNQAVTTKSAYEVEYRIRRYDGAYRHFLARGVPVFKDDGNIQEWVGTCIDITERKHIEDAQKFLVQCGLPASGEDFFKSLARYLAENLGMDYVCIDRLQGEGLAAQTVAIYFDGKFEDNLTYTLKDTPCGDVVEKTICCFPKGVRHLYPQDIVLQEMMAESYIGTILWSSKGQPIGLIAIIGRQPLANPQLAESMLKLVAVRAAGELERREAEEALRQRSLELQELTETLEQRVLERTVELAITNEALRQLSTKLLSAQEDERKRIAGELHDTIGSYLGGIKFKVEDVVEQIEKTPKAATESLNTIVPVIQEAIEECRRIQMDLRPSMLDDLGLLPTLSWFFRRFETIYSGIRIEQEIGIEEVAIPGHLRTVIYRVIQEAMNNIAKHSKADSVKLSLRRHDDKLELVLQDNGRGFDREKADSQKSASRGLGLSSMRERVGLSLGSFAIESTEGKGTIIRAFWPIKQ